MKTRSSVQIRETGTFRVLEAMPDGPKGEKIFKVILISEGPGNRRNKNFYGPEAVSSAVKAFEGKWCYLNHQAEDEADTLPERRVQDKAGYYKNLGIIQVKEGSACAGELHCDLSESGAMLAAKVQSALKYKESFPDNDLEYVGFSVNADGDAESRDMTAKGGGPEDNYVTAITEGDSCDLVTTPARGGRGLAVIKEDKNGVVSPTSQEEGMKKLKAFFAKFSEALKSLPDEEKKKFAESHKALSALVKESEGEGYKSSEEESEAWAAKKEGESDEDHMARLHEMVKAIDKHIGDKTDATDGSDSADDDDADAEEARADSRPRSARDLRRQRFRQLDDDSRRAAFAHMDADESARYDGLIGAIRESGLPKGTYSDEEFTRLMYMPYKEAKAIIAKDARLAKSIRESIQNSVASLHRGVQESGVNAEARFLEAAKEA